MRVEVNHELFILNKMCSNCSKVLIIKCLLTGSFIKLIVDLADLFLDVF